MGDVRKTALILAVTINVGSRDAEVRRGRSRGRIDPVVQYQAFHARSDWYITMIFITIPPSGRPFKRYSRQKFLYQLLASMKLETCFPLWLKWEDCDNDPSRNKQRTTGVYRSRSLKVGKHCNDWLRTHQYELLRDRGQNKKNSQP
jgi:hypothetical protein